MSNGADALKYLGEVFTPTPPPTEENAPEKSVKYLQDLFARPKATPQPPDVSTGDLVQGNVLRSQPPEDLPQPPQGEPISLLTEYRQRFPLSRASDEVVLKVMRESKAPNVDQNRFNALARDPNGRTALLEEINKPLTGLQQLRKMVPAAATKSDDEFLHLAYDTFSRKNQLNTQITSFDDFKDMMNPQVGILNTVQQTLKSFAAGTGAAGRQANAQFYNLVNAPEALSQAIIQAMDSFNPEAKPGSQLRTVGQAATAWWNRQINDFSKDPNAIVPTLLPIAAKQYGDLYRQFVAWVSGIGEAQHRQSQADDAKINQAAQLAQVSGGPVGKFFAQGAGVVGKQGTSMTIGSLMYALPGTPVKNAAILAGIIGGTTGVTEAVQAHSDHALLDGFESGGMNIIFPYMTESPNGRLLSAVTNIFADTGEDTVKKWLRGEKVDFTDVFWGLTLDAGGGVLAGMHANARAVPDQLKALAAQRLGALPAKPLALTYPEVLTSGSVPAAEIPRPVKTPVDPSLRGVEWLEAQEQSQREFAAQTQAWEASRAENQERGFVTRAAPEQWEAAGIEFQKAIEAREAGDYQKAAQFMDRTFATLPNGERREFAKRFIQYTKDATAPVQPIRAVKGVVAPEVAPEAAPEPPADPNQQRINDIVQNDMFGLSPKRGEAGAAANPFGGRQYRYVYGQGLVPLEDVPRETSPGRELTHPEFQERLFRLNDLRSSGQLSEENYAQAYKALQKQVSRGFLPSLKPSEAVPVEKAGTIMGAYGPLASTHAEVDRAIENLKQIQREIPIDVEAVPVGEAPKALPSPQESKIQDAYTNILPTQLGSAVKISELARESGMSVAETKKVVSDLAAKGDASLDEGHWPSATDEERAAAITQRGTPRLLVRFPRLADRGEAGFTINWINEMHNWVEEHWPRPFERFISAFMPQIRDETARAMWASSKRQTSAAQMAVEAIPRKVARAVEMDKTLRGGERPDRRMGVFDRLPDAVKKEVLSQSEEGLVHTGNTQVDWLMNSFYRPIFKAINNTERLLGFVYKAREFYFYHALSRSEQDRFVAWYDNYLAADPRWTQQRQLPTYRTLFEARFTPVTLNPERLFQMRLASSFQAIRKVLTLRDAAQPGWGAIAKNRLDPNTGQYISILTPKQTARYTSDPSYMSQRAPNGEDYFITKNAFQVIKNAWEPSRLYTDYTFSPIAKAYVTAKAIGTRGLLGWSLAHLQHVAVIYPASALVRLERNFLGRNRIAAFNQSLTDMMKNRQSTNHLINAWRGLEEPRSVEERDVLNDFNQMGLKLDLSEEQELGFSRWLAEQFPRMRDAQASVMAGKFVDLGYKLWTAEPLQEYQFKHAIPWMKASAALLAREGLYQSRPELLKPGHELERATALAKLGDTIDARFGEINYANVYWAKLYKDLGQMSFLSLGWTMNTVQFVGGFLHDMGSNVIHVGELMKKLRGDPSEHQFLTDRILFTLNYSAMVMMANGLRQYVMTGLSTGQPQLPEGRDYVFPRIGKDNRGNWIRARPIEFTTEFGIPYVADGMLQHHAEQAGGLIPGALEMGVNKLNPYINNVIHAFENQNYFGQEIRSRLDPWPKQVLDVVKYVLADPMTPITGKAAFAGRPGELDWHASVASFFGMPRASAWTGRSHIENLITQSYFEDHPGARSVEGQEWTRAHVALSNAVRNKDQAGIKTASDDLRALGGTEKGISQTIKLAHKLPTSTTQHYFHALNPIVQGKILQQMSPEERTIYLPLATKGIQDRFPTATMP